MRSGLRQFLKGVGAMLLAAAVVNMSVLLGVSQCLCVEDYDNCGTAHCDCFEDVSDTGCAASGAEGCVEISIDALDALLEGSLLKRGTLPVGMPLPVVMAIKVSNPLLLRGVIPLPTAPPWRSYDYISLAPRLYPRS